MADVKTLREIARASMVEDWRAKAAHWHEARAAIARESAMLADTVGSSLGHQHQEVWHRRCAEELRAEMAPPKDKGKQG